jgi:putative DNA primase/helicase
MQRSPLHAAARLYAQAGFPVFPIIPGEKRPACPHGHKEATTDLGQIDQWWAANALYNIGVDPHGCGCGVVDAEHNADRVWLRKLPATWTIKTPRGGLHLWYYGALGNSVKRLATNVDTRGAGEGYTILPPSQVNGKIYRVVRDMAIAPLPPWLTLPGKPAPLKNGHDFEVDSAGNVARAVTYLHGLEEIREKEGADARTYAVACAMRDLGLSADKTFELMLEHYKCRPKDSRFNAFLQLKITHAYEYATNPPGVHAAPSSATLANSPAIQEAMREQRTFPFGPTKLEYMQGRTIPMLRTDWLWHNRLPMAMCSLIAGHTKLGKTTVLLDIAARVTTGANWPDGGKAPIGSVIYFSGEDDPSRTIMPRFMASGGNPDRFFVVQGVRTDEEGIRTFNLAADLEELAKMLAELGDVRLLIFDPISSYFSNTDTFRNSEVRSVLEPMVRFAAQHNVTVIGNTHLGKSAKGPANLRVLDSVAFTATVRAIYMIAKDDADPKRRRLFLPAGGNIAREMDGLAFTIEAKFVAEGIIGTYIQWEKNAVTETADDVYADADKVRMVKSSALSRCMDWAREFLADGSKHSAEFWTAAEAEGLAEGTMRRALQQLGVARDKARGSMSAGWLMTLPRS